MNVRRLGVANVELRQGNWCAALDGWFDAIVSNPPYIAPDHPALAALRHEPAGALVSGDSGFADLLAIAGCACEHLRPGALLLLEHGSEQAPRLAAELAALGYRDITCHRDLAGLDRATRAIWP
jgi:release factor glutamine methyltransferase